MLNPQQRLVAEVATIFPDAVFYKQTTQRVMSLTIDDGPTPRELNDRSMQVILDAIAEHNQQVENPQELVRATFFIISNHLRENTTIIEKILQQGHEIGNHGVEDETTVLLTPKKFEQQLKEAHEQLCRLSNQPIRWYRPGRGLYNKKMLESLRRVEGYEPRFALASMLPVDTFKPTDDSRFTVWYASRFFFPGSILVFHVGTLQRAENTSAALKVILAALKQRNYRVVTFSELWDL